MTTPLTAARIHEVRLANDELFWRQPHVHGVGEGFFPNDDGTWSTDYGISVYVTQVTVQSTLPIADRIASTISGVPVRIIVEPELDYTGAIGHREHRPVLAGVRIISAKETVDNPLTVTVDEGGNTIIINVGTLTGLATRNTDGKKFLVLNQHILTGNARTSPSGNEKLYQQTITEASEGTFRLNPSKKIGGGDGLATGVPVLPGPTENNVADLAMCSYDDDSDADMGFLLHGHGDDANRRVVPGAVDPVFDGENLVFSPSELLMVGAAGGEGIVRILGINQTRTVGRTGSDKRATFTGLIILDCLDRRAEDGDSGAPCLLKVADKKYKMVGIEFAKRLEGIVANAGRIAYAFPASVAERELGISFGNTPPVAIATAPERVDELAEVALKGEDSYDPDNDTITYLWEQENAGPPGLMIANPTSYNTTFTAPNFAPSTVIFRLTVTDSKGDEAIARVTIKVGPEFPSSSHSPGNPPPPLEDPPPDDPPPPPPPPPPPRPQIIWRLWEDTGTTRGCGPLQEKQQSRASNRGHIQYRWMSDSRPEIWGDWSPTGMTRGSGQTREARETRTSNCDNTQTRWVSAPEIEIWYAWADTGRYEYIDAYTWFKEQARNSSYGNRETRWVAG